MTDPVAPNLVKVEQLLFDELSKDVDINQLPVFFILGSPRTGSTLIYQLLINAFAVSYFSTFINACFPKLPILGAALETCLHRGAPVSYESQYGKTSGLFGPSEASSVFKNWFGGEHPSQTRSCEVLPGKRSHLIQTFKSIYRLTGHPIVTKNAWNCFRIKELSTLLPNAHFIWIRRDISLSALSDLLARYQKGSPSTTWNSATTANYQEIQKKPYWEQVVEQQYWYGKSINRDLNEFAKGRRIQVWYEDLCRDPGWELDRLNEYFKAKSLGILRTAVEIPAFASSEGESQIHPDFQRITSYIKAHRVRLQDFMYAEK